VSVDESWIEVDERRRTRFQDEPQGVGRPTGRGVAPGGDPNGEAGERDEREDGAAHAVSLSVSPLPLPLPLPSAIAMTVHAFGRFLQVFGLILLPVGLLYGTSSGASNALAIELTALAVGALCFVLGQRMAGRRS
jgi:hypothetical protein